MSKDNVVPLNKEATSDSPGFFGLPKPKAQVDLSGESVLTEGSTWSSQANCVPPTHTWTITEPTTQHINPFYHPELADAHAYLTSLKIPKKNQHGELDLRSRIEILYTSGLLQSMLSQDSEGHQSSKNEKETGQATYLWQQIMTEENAAQILTQLIQDLSNRIRLMPGLQATKSLRNALAKLVNQVLDL
jgi:hypothetical protein